MTGSDILIFLVLIQAKHYLADFQWQTREMVMQKGQYMHPAGLLHAGVHAVLSIPVMLVSGFGGLGLILLLAIAEFVLHHHIDWFKLHIQHDSIDVNDARYWNLLGLDQAAHQLTYVAMLAIGLI